MSDDVIELMCSNNYHFYSEVIKYYTHEPVFAVACPDKFPAKPILPYVLLLILVKIEKLEIIFIIAILK